MTAIETAIAVRVIAQPLVDLYNTGKERFEIQLSKFKNSSARKALAQKIAATQKVKTFWQRDKEVLLSSFYYPNKIVFNKECVKDASTLREFPSIGNYVIQGTIGQGKSIFLRHLCVQELGEKSSGRIPIFVEFKTITGQGLRKSIFESFERLGFEINDNLFDFYAESNKIVLLLDAFDELDESLIKETIAFLEFISERYPRLQIFITSRPDSDIQNSRFFRVVQLAPLHRDDHGPFLRRIGNNEKDVSKLIDAINSSSAEVTGLLSTPLMLTLFVVVYKAEHSIPKELPDFFDSLFQTLFTKHDKSKPGLVRPQKSGLGERKLQQLFQGFCFSILQLKEGVSLTNEQFHSAFEKAVKHTEIETTPEGFRHDIVKVACLMAEEGFLLQFIHKSIVEFYAASFVRGLHEEMAAKFYSQQSRNQTFWYHWRQVLQFLSQIDKFRYTKYYAIPSMHRDFFKFRIDPSDEFFEKNFDVKAIWPDLRLGFNKNNKGSFVLSHIGPISIDSQFMPELQSVSHSFFVAYSGIEFPEAKFEKYQKITHSNEDILIDEEIRVPWCDFVSQEVYKNVFDETAGALKACIRRLHQYESYLANESKKIDLLDL